jgi:hypothetical protein
MAEVELDWPEDRVPPAQSLPEAAGRGHPALFWMLGVVVGLVIGMAAHASGTSSSSPAPSPAPLAEAGALDAGADTRTTPLRYGGPPADPGVPLPGVRDVQPGARSLAASPSEPRSDCHAVTFADPGVVRAAVTAANDGSCTTSDIRGECVARLVVLSAVSPETARLDCANAEADPARLFAAPHPG